MHNEIIDGFEKGITAIQEGVTRTEKNVTDLSAALKSVQDENERLQSDLSKVHRLCLARATAGVTAPEPGHGQ